MLLRCNCRADPPFHRRPPMHTSSIHPFCCALQATGRSSARPVQLADIPGHPRVRGQLERYAERAAGVVFVIDSVDFMPRKTETAE